MFSCGGGGGGGGGVPNTKSLYKLAAHARIQKIMAEGVQLFDAFFVCFLC